MQKIPWNPNGGFENISGYLSLSRCLVQEFFFIICDSDLCHAKVIVAYRILFIMLKIVSMVFCIVHLEPGNFSYSSQLWKCIKHFCQDISKTSRYFSKIWVWSVDLMSWQGLCWILSHFTDFEGQQTLLINVRCKMTCHILWNSTETGDS